MKIKKAEESPVIIHKRKETGFSNRGFKPIIKRETDSALPEYNNGGAFFYGNYKPAWQNVDNGKGPVIYSHKTMQGNITKIEYGNVEDKKIANTKNNAEKETYVKNVYETDITTGGAGLTETAAPDITQAMEKFPATYLKNILLLHLQAYQKQEPYLQ